jgi:hypothetical protein
MEGCSLLMWHIDFSCCLYLRSACWLGWHLVARQRSLQFLLWFNGCLGLCMWCTAYFPWCHVQFHLWLDGCVGLWTWCRTFFLGATTETLENLSHAPWSFAFGCTLVVSLYFSFFFAAAFGVFVSFNLKLDGNFIIPSSFNKFKFGSVKCGFPFPYSIIFLDASFAWVIQLHSCLCGSLFGI